MATEKPFLDFRRDENNGAGLHAVFLGDRAIHHFKAGTDVTKYMADIQRNLDAELLKAADALLLEAARRHCLSCHHEVSFRAGTLVHLRGNWYCDAAAIHRLREELRHGK